MSWNLFKPTATNLRVLCVESDPTDRTAMQDYGWILGWNVVLCSSVAEGLEFLSKTRFDLIVYGLDREVAAACNTLAKLRNDGGANADSPILLLVNDRYPQEDLRDDCTLSIATIQKKPLMLSNLKSVATRLAESAHEDPLTRQR